MEVRPSVPRPLSSVQKGPLEFSFKYTYPVDLPQTPASKRNDAKMPVKETKIEYDSNYSSDEETESEEEETCMEFFSN